MSPPHYSHLAPFVELEVSMEPKLDLDWFDASIRAKSAKLCLVSRAHVTPSWRTLLCQMQNTLGL
jgi:hypothetical protein